MTDEQANNKLPEKTIPDEIKSAIITQAQVRYGDKTTYEHGQQACFIAGAEFGYKETIPLIELTNNNLLAALEEVKRLKGLIKDNWMQYSGRQYVFTSHCDKMWKQFCKENNITP